MLAVLSSCHDAVARAFASRHRQDNVHLLTCAELSQPGWRLSVRARSREVSAALTARIGGRLVAAGEIAGVVTRLRSVTDQELPHIVPEDRSYVASEMHAFLFAFLAALPCPVVNPPSPACLCGPNLRPVEWRKLARELAIPSIHELDVAAAALRTATFSEQETMQVTIVGERTLGAASEPLQEWSRALARRAGVSYLRVHYRLVGSTPCFVGADPRPCLESEAIGDALLGCFSAGTATC